MPLISLEVFRNVDVDDEEYVCIVQVHWHMFAGRSMQRVMPYHLEHHDYVELFSNILSIEYVRSTIITSLTITLRSIEKFLYCFGDFRQDVLVCLFHIDSIVFEFSFLLAFCFGLLLRERHG